MRLRGHAKLIDELRARRRYQESPQMTFKKGMKRKRERDAAIERAFVRAQKVQEDPCIR